jgi:CHAT domain-containing protein
VLAERRVNLARLVVRGPVDDDPASHLAELDRARRDKERAELELAAISESFQRELARAHIGYRDLATLLSSGEAAVAYLRFSQLPLDAFPHDWGDPSNRSNPSYVAFVASGSPPRTALVRLGEASVIDGLVSRLRGGVDDMTLAADRSPGRSEAVYRIQGRELRRAIWDPLQPYLEGAARVHIVPDGSLNLVNLSALPTGETGYLIDTERRLHYLTAERDLVQEPEPRTGLGLLVLGDPAFDEPSLFALLRIDDGHPIAPPPMNVARLRIYRGPTAACGTFQNLRFEPLPASGLEIDEITTLWPDEKTDQGTASSRSNRESLGLRGPTASEAALKALAPGHRVLHLATHGFFLGTGCAAAPGRDVSGDLAIDPDNNPLLMSGLALAGANRRQAAASDEEDGILTSEEIASLDLTSVEWAVLSACDTGVGEVRAGEGVFGLRRAFQVAGARTLIMSLWPVEDEATRAWMRELYTNRFAKNMTTIDAVHEASLALLNQRREEGLSTHPFYWAGFIASGDWR